MSILNGGVWGTARALSRTRQQPPKRQPASLGGQPSRNATPARFGWALIITYPASQRKQCVVGHVLATDYRRITKLLPAALQRPLAGAENRPWGGTPGGLYMGTTHKILANFHERKTT